MKTVRILSCIVSRNSKFLTINSQVQQISRANIFGKKKEEKKEDDLYSIVAQEEEQKYLSEKEEELERKRNKSGLNVQHQNLINGRIPYDKPMDEYHNTLAYKRRMFARFGNKSNIDPGTLWPNANDIQKILNYEQVAYPYTIPEQIAKETEKKKLEQKAILERQEKILANLKKLDQWKREVEQRAAKRLQDFVKAKAKKDALIEEVYKHFGYKVNERDQKFKDMLVEKEKAQKKKLKLEKAKARQEQLLEQSANKST